MKIGFIGLIIILYCFSCTTKVAVKEANFDWLDITINNGWDASFSLKVNKEGHLLLGKGNPTNSYFTGKLTSRELGSIDSLIQVNLRGLTDSFFINNKSDQVATAIIVYQNSKRRPFYLYGNSAPTSLITLRDYIYKIANDQTIFVTSDTLVNFESSTFTNPPAPPIPGNL